MSIENKTDEITLSIARLGLRLQAQDKDLQLASPPSYQEFVQPAAQPQAFFHNCSNSESQDDKLELILRINNEPINRSQRPESSLFRADNWDIWLDENDNFVLEALRLPPARRVTIETGFTRGEIQGNFSSFDYEGIYPLLNLDMKIFVNWLAGFGDLILHASAVVVDGKGYCFSGPAHIGKSTLVESLQRNHDLTVLGEDQVILRFLDGRFWVFGTPWHENPTMCSAQGVPLEKLFFLERCPDSVVKPLKPVDGMARILQNAFIPYYRQDLLPGILDRLELLSSEVPFFSLSYTLGSDPWQAILEA